MHPLIALPMVGSVRSHSLMILLAIVVAGSLAYRQAVRSGLAARRVLGAIVLIALGTFGAGRLHFVLAHWDLFQNRPWRALAVSSSALHAPGAVAGLALSTVIVLGVLRIPRGRFVDALVPAACFGIALARIGCFLHGCCFGKACPYPWGIRFPDAELIRSAQIAEGILPGGAVEPLPVHPLQLYFAAAAAGIGIFLLWLAPRKKYEGQLGLVFLVLFFGSSAILEPLRADSGARVTWAGVPQLLWIGAGLALLSAAALATAEAVERLRPSKTP